MRLPKKITPDRIRESIVQVFYSSDIPFEPMVGYIYGVLGEMGFQYTNRPLRQQKGVSGTNQQEINLGELIIVPQHFFFDEKIKIQLHQNGSLIFNCINEYIGWTEYFKFIKNVISKLTENKIILGSNRIGIRYISEFPNIDILENIKLNFEMSGIKNKISNANFRVEWADAPHKIIANIGSKLPISSITGASEVKTEYVSLIDLDIILQDLEITNNEKLFETIDVTHTKQKIIFFGLLQDEFLATLKPEYD
jgi:uncharacterized protein (TIGR04255 family)